MTDFGFPRSLLALDDEGLETIMALSKPILASERGDFLQALASELEAHPDASGPGSIHRIASELQRRFMRHQDAARGPAARLHERRS
jgi:hypothetical protein